MPLPDQDERKLARMLHDVLEGFDHSHAVRRIRFRLRDMGENQLDEVAQLRLIQRACREEPALSAAFVTAGFPAIEDLPLSPPTPETGKLVQAFNRMVETWWEAR